MTRELRTQSFVPVGTAGPDASPAESAPLLYTIPDVCRRLSLGQTKVRELIARGDLPCVRIGTSVRIADKDLEAFVEGLRWRNVA